MKFVIKPIYINLSTIWVNNLYENSGFKKGLFAATVTMSAAQLQAVTPVDFSNLVDQVSPAVVSVSVVKKMSEEELLQQQVPEILRRFFGNQVIIPQPRVPQEKPDMGVPSSLVRMAIC